MSFWCERAWLPVTAGRRAACGSPRGRAGRSSRSSRASPAPAATCGSAGVVLPGLANAHSHAFHRALRGRTHAGGGTFWTWRERMYALAAAPDPGQLRALARAVFAEMALAGTTAVGEFHYVHHRPDGSPTGDPNAMAEALRWRPPTPGSS